MINSDIWIKITSRFCICFHQTGFGLNIRCVNLMVSGSVLVWPWWRYQMETFSALLGHLWGNSSQPPVNSPKGQWRGALMFSLICVWINGWVNKREAGDLRRYHAHYDVIVVSNRVLVSYTFYLLMVFKIPFTDNLLVCFFLDPCLLVMLWKNLLTDFHWIFMICQTRHRY